MGGGESVDSAFSAPDEETGFLQWRLVRLFKEIWKEITFGVGAWGTLRPLITALLASIPFLFLGQHFNRQHKKGFDWMCSNNRVMGRSMAVLYL
jgi:hypothetical protein